MCTGYDAEITEPERNRPKGQGQVPGLEQSLSSEAMADWVQPCIH